MRVLHVNKFLYRRGGAEAYLFDLAELQRRAGHTVEFFGMDHPENETLALEALFPSNVELDPAPATLPGKARAVGRMLYSSSARRGMEAALESFTPDVVHLHNIYHQLSPSVLRPLRDVPAVMTLHDYKLVCPTYLFLDHGQLCEACLGGHFSQAVKRRCNDGSLAKSAVSAFETAWHTRTNAYAPVNLFACPSRFLLGKMTAGGVFPDRMRHLPLFVDFAGMIPAQRPGRDAIYVGRLSNEKGPDVLVRAAAVAGVAVDIVGDGPDRAALEALASELGVEARFHGRVPRERVHELMRNAAVTVVPSRCYENQPLAVLESFACGVPVLGSDLGGISELVEPGVDGALVAADDPEALAAALATLLRDEALLHAYGRAGRAKVERGFAPEVHLARLEELYREAGANA
jgi:glycosyltransferase involved in cell wall biosynthesis